MRLPAAILALTVLAIPALSQNSSQTWISMVAEAIQKSQLTLPGSVPFHIKAAIVEVEDPTSDFRAAIEEYWVAPDKWRRTIESPDFSQTVVVNGDKTFENDAGDYYPSWLDDFITAMLNPLPLTVPANLASDTGFHANSQLTSVCTRLNTSIDQWSVCFDPRLEVLTSVFSKQTGYAPEFHDFKSFGKKQVARRIVIYPAPGFKLQASVTQLEELQNPDEQMFAIDQPTPPENRITMARVSEETFRSLVLSDTSIQWPTVRDGALKGGCAVYVTADRAGHVREAWPGGCDNAGLEGLLDDTVRKWLLKVPLSNGVPVQAQARLTFPFTTTIADPLPVLSDAEVRALATKIVAPVFPAGVAPSGTQVIVNISVDETGKFTGGGPAQPGNDKAFLAAYRALTQWEFKPYVKDGKPQYFHAQVIFVVP